MRTGKTSNRKPSLRTLHIREYEAWINMLHRCHNPANHAYDNWGGRGISVCDRWRQYATGLGHFIADMGPRPDGHSLERKDNNLGYTPENCVWADRITQQANRRKPVMWQLDFGLGYDSNRSPYIMLNGEKKTLKEWAEQFNLKPATVRHRLIRGVDIAHAFLPCTRKGENKRRILPQLTLNTPASNDNGGVANDQ